MSKHTSFPLAALFAALIALPSCRKACDFIHDHPDAHDSLCRITRLTVRGFFRNPDTFNIAYNAKGNPVSMLAKDPPGTLGNVDHYYRYDRFDRLSDYMITFIGSTGAIGWDKYAYPRKDYVTDTSFSYVGTVDGPSPVSTGVTSYSIRAYTLDAHGRIVKVWEVPTDPHQPPVLQRTITYDANGNLPLPSPDLSYDDKVNIYRTSKTWQFVYNDYSRNNVIKDDHLFFPTYNSFGLPLYIRNLESYYIYPFNIENTDPVMTVTYACSPPHGPVNY